MKHFLAILSCLLAFNTFSQEEEINPEDLRDEIEHLEELIFKQAMQIDELNAGSLTSQLASNQTAYSKSVLQSTTLGFGSGILILGGLSSGQELAMVAGAGGALAAVFIRLSGIIKFYKNSRFDSMRADNNKKTTNGIRSPQVAVRPPSDNLLSSDYDTKFKKRDLVQVKLRDGNYYNGVVSQVTKRIGGAFQYSVNYNDENNKRKYRTFKEADVRLRVE
ncbi:hypothetical protein N9L13_08300 [Flavobacteriales bacterium]|nr:hypothetical protein [Flavobacteriales bacterium]